jgi:hypothetical protein
VVGFAAGFTELAAGLVTLPADLVGTSVVVTPLVVTSETFTGAGAGFCAVAGVTAAVPVEGLMVPAELPAGGFAVAAGVPVGRGLGGAGVGIWAEGVAAPGVVTLAVELTAP